VDSGSTVNVRVLQVGGDFGNTFQRTASIRLVPASVSFNPGSPVPSFLYAPLNPAVGQPVTFDAGDSHDEDGVIVSYRWDYGDGDVETRTTPRETHDYLAAGTYFVTLTVTDNEGKTSSLTKAIVVG
jgi:PKD repeat protein